MPFKTVQIVIVLLIASLSIVSAKAGNSVITNAIALCKTNPVCSYKPTDGGGAMFKLKKTAQSKYVMCSQNGACKILMPKGQKSVISNIMALLATN